MIGKPSAFGVMYRTRNHESTAGDVLVHVLGDSRFPVRKTIKSIKGNNKMSTKRPLLFTRVKDNFPQTRGHRIRSYGLETAVVLYLHLCVHRYNTRGFMSGQSFRRYEIQPEMQMRERPCCEIRLERSVERQAAMAKNDKWLSVVAQDVSSP